MLNPSDLVISSLDPLDKENLKDKLDLIISPVSDKESAIELSKESFGLIEE